MRRILVKKVLSMLLVFAAVLTLLPATSRAAEVINTNVTWGSQILTGDYIISPGVTVTVTGTLTVNGVATISGGGTIKRGNGFFGDLIYAGAGHTLNLTNITVDGGAVWGGMPLTQATPNVAGFNAGNSTLLYANGGMLNIGGGTVLQNNDTGSFHAGYNGGSAVVAINGATLVMQVGSRIISNREIYSGAVLLYGAALSLIAGEISGNYSNAGAGGVCLINSPMTMVESAEIKNNATNGNGGGMELLGTLTMNGGSITGNTCGNGRNGGGVYFYGGAPLLFMHANASITGNTKIGLANNVFVSNGRYLQVSNAYFGNVGITTEISPIETGIVAVAGGSGYGITSADAARIVSDTPALYETRLNGTSGDLGATVILGNKTYPVAYDAHAGADIVTNVPVTQTKTRTVNLTLSNEEPVRTGYAFIQWNTAAGGTGTNYLKGALYTADSEATLFAQWNPQNYTVTFDPNTGTLPGGNTSDVTFGSAYGVLPTPTKHNSTFSGWFTEEIDGTEVTADTLVAIASAHTLYAHWDSAASPRQRRTITHMPTSIQASGYFSSGAKLVVSPMETLEAYSGWQQAQEYFDNGLVIAAYDVSVTGSYSGSVELSLFVGAQYDGMELTVLHFKNGITKQYKGIVQNGSLQITVDSLSPFVVTGLPVPSETVMDPPKTGGSGMYIGFSVLLLSLACIVLCVVKKKRV